MSATATDVDTVAAPVLVVEEPGFYDIDDATYFADPVPGGSISQSEIKRFLEGTPAAYKWSLDNPKPTNSGQSLGTFVHATIMDQPIEVAEYTGKAKTWTAADSAAFRAAALAEGKVPLLPSERSAGEGMVAALRQHREAMRLIKGRKGERVTYETAGFVIDPVTEMWLRGKFDILGESGGGEPAIRDVKTLGRTLTVESISKAIYEYGYHIQDATYRTIVGLLTDTDPREIDFAFIFVSSVEPHQVAVVRLPERAKRLGEQVFGDGLDLLADCIKNDNWPGFETPMVVDLPGWAYRRQSDV